MSRHCENCGTRMSDGYCPNCEEEAFIYETQRDFMPADPSDEFMRKVHEQQETKDERDHSPSPPSRKV